MTDPALFQSAILKPVAAVGTALVFDTNRFERVLRRMAGLDGLLGITRALGL